MEANLSFPQPLYTFVSPLKFNLTVPCFRFQSISLNTLQFGTAAAVGILAGVILGVFSPLVTSQLGMADNPRDRRRSKKRYLEESAATTPGESSSNETDWQWLEPSPTRRRPAGGLLSQTIHEEDGSSDEAL